ncbi:MAG: acetolactate synthase small subunit [Kiritimatiellaeota bacterium]|nr:acetolactate synthase small subunit [Kiritimatiellota bacterium]
MKQHTISVLVENKFGVLARIAGLFSGRGYNIESLSVNSTQDPTISRMTIVTSGDENVIEQIDKQLNKLIDVIKVTDLAVSDFIERELILVKVAVTAKNRSDIIQITEIFGGKIISVHKKELAVELSGNGEKIDNFISLLAEYEIIELVRTGRVAISRHPGVTEA